MPSPEIVKVKEWIPHIGPLTKIIALKLFLDIVPSFSSKITCALHGYFPEGSVSKHRKTSKAVGMSSMIFWLQERGLRLSVCFDTFRNSNRSVNKRRMSPAQTTAEWTAEKSIDKRQKINEKRQANPQTQARQPNRQMVKSAGRRSLPKLQKSSLSSNGNNVDYEATSYSIYESRENLD